LLVLASFPVYLVSLREPRAWVILAAIVGFGLLGLIDDIYGTREAGGFSGHIGLLRKGRVSTGLIKAVVGGLLGLFLGFAAAGFRPVPGIINGFLIALCANLLNLLDLRPGRAVSCFWLVLFLLAVTGAVEAGRLVLLLPLLIPAVWVTWLDRSARVMLGDAGSNVLGAVIGLVLAYELGMVWRLVAIVLIAAVHVYSERRSISALIEGNRFLKSVDGLLGER
jgi:UDP-N-acetylmuramyl pentapeptide phosphotransferase/UDP-N-acetylglucosamine-1-phosphate transferase